jgi:hypothetical protein
LTLVGSAAFNAESAPADMCMANCWSWEGDWEGGGGGSWEGDGGSDPDDGVGGADGDDQVGGVPDNSPSGTGWDDARLAPHDSDILPRDTYADAGTGGSGDAGTSSSTTSDRGNLVCSVVGGKIGGGKGGAAYGACYIAYDQMCRATHDSGNVPSCQRTKQCLDTGKPLSECKSAWFRISRGGDISDPWPDTEAVCKAKPSLPQCGGP